MAAIRSPRRGTIGRIDADAASTGTFLGDRYSVIMDSDDGETHLTIEGQSATELPDSSIFA